MSDRALARHRAPQRPLTPLDSLTDTLSGQLSAATDQFGSMSRSGAVLAVSTGLVATMALPASAATTAAPDTGAALARTSTAGNVATAPEPARIAPDRAPISINRAPISVNRAPISITRARLDKPVLHRLVPQLSRSSSVSRSSSRSSTSTAPQPVAGTSAVRSTIVAGTKGTVGSTRGALIVSIARKYIGLPYRYGGTTTAGFDCSGFTKYVFGRVGISLPRTSRAQYAAVRHISRGQARKGDMVFFIIGGRVRHVGIVTRPGVMIDSPRTGKSISERAIWSGNVVYGRP
jgi:peptidoglycan DL-endopeptidase CwlO